MAKRRLDEALVERGLVASRTAAQALILAGRVFTGERRLEKAGQQIAVDLDLTVRDAGPGWVSRGALKLIAGLDAFGIEVVGRTAADIGASTGGFTEVLLKRGASRVYAVDVGYGQLAASLRSDPRVVVLERQNARYLTREHIPQPLDLVVCDASFISLKLVLPAALTLAAPDARLVALIKPQFEVGRGQVGKGGVVRDPALHEAVCEDIRRWLDSLPGWSTLGVTPSPITGPAGNREFLISGRKAGA